MGRLHNIQRVKLRWIHWTEWIKAISLQLETRFKKKTNLKRHPVRTCTFLAFVHEVALLFSKKLWVITESFVYCNGIMLKQSVCLYKWKPLWISAYTNFLSNHAIGLHLYSRQSSFGQDNAHIVLLFLAMNVARKHQVSGLRTEGVSDWFEAQDR